MAFKDAVLKLSVTPQITSANTVIMQITLENATPDFSRSVLGIPPINTQRAITQVQVNDGATTIIGGIFVSNEQSSNERTPLLHRIPLLGWLFQRDATLDSSTELHDLHHAAHLEGLRNHDHHHEARRDTARLRCRSWCSASVSCGDMAREGQASSYLIITQLKASPAGVRRTFGGKLKSDVVTAAESSTTTARSSSSWR